MLSDLRFAFRQLTKNPGFTLIAVFALALGIGANTAIFSVINAVLLKPLPFPEPDQLVAVGSTSKRDGAVGLSSMSFPDFFDLRKQTKTLTSVAVSHALQLALTGTGEVRSLRGLMVTADFFDVLGLKPAYGHSFARDDEAAGGGPGGLKVVLGHSFWQQQFQSDPGAIGRTLTLNRQSYTVIGVLAAGAQFPIQKDSIEVYVTCAVEAVSPSGPPNTEQRGSHSLNGIGRLKPGVPLETAQAELRQIAAELTRLYPDTNTNFGLSAVPLREDLVGDVRIALYVLFGAVACVLLIACANVANLLLARATVRARELAVRAALGASRSRIVRQLLAESMLLSLLGAVLGIVIAALGTQALLAVVPQSIPRAADIALDYEVLAFTVLISLFTGVFFGLVPALQASRPDLNRSLKEDTRGGIGGGGRHRLRNALVITEVALALVLLVGAGLLIQSFSRLGQVNPGLRTERMLTARITLPETAYTTPEALLTFQDQLLEKVRALPGVRGASAVVPLPLSGGESVTDFDIEEHPLPEGSRADSPVRIAEADYFNVMGIPVVRGRSFDARDTLKGKQVVLINERFAQKYFPGQDPIGKRIQPGMSIGEEKAAMREIIGIVGNVRSRSLHREPTTEMYLPSAQLPLDYLFLVLRTETPDANALTAPLRAALASVDRNLPLGRIAVFDEYISRSLARPRFNAILLAVFAGVALLLTAIGIYGVMAYTVAQRTGEIGIRMALGAERSSIYRLILGHAARLVGVSLVLGLIGAFVFARLMGSLLFDISAFDPLTFGLIPVFLAVVAFLASWLPAHRASRVDPIIALRAD